MNNCGRKPSVSRILYQINGEIRRISTEIIHYSLAACGDFIIHQQFIGLLFDKLQFEIHLCQNGRKTSGRLSPPRCDLSFFLFSYAEHPPQEGGNDGRGAQDHDLHGGYLPFCICRGGQCHSMSEKRKRCRAKSNTHQNIFRDAHYLISTLHLRSIG